MKELIMNFAKKHKKEKLYVIVALKLGGVDGADSLLRFPPSKIPVQIGDAATERGKDENSAIEARGEDDKVDEENDEDALEGGKRSH
jgi:hypothetical protein